MNLKVVTRAENYNPFLHLVQATKIPRLLADSSITSPQSSNMAVVFSSN